MAAPRYIDRDDVDSTSMYSAALYSYQADRLLWDQLELYGNLTVVVHRDVMGFEEAIHAADIVRCILCKRGMCCNRCKDGIGGWEFRWLSPIWSRKYVENARRGSWLPGKSETRWRRPITYPYTKMNGLNGLPAISNSRSNDREDSNDSNTSDSDGPPPMVRSDTENTEISRISKSFSDDEDPDSKLL